MKKETFKIFFRLVNIWLPPLLWGFFIFSFSSVTTPRVSVVHWQDFFIKKTAHLIEYGFLAVLLFRALKGSGVESKRAFIYSFFTCFLYGFTDEFHQSFTPGREPAIRDALIDGVGSFTALLGVKEVLPKTSGKFKKFMFKLGIEY